MDTPTIDKLYLELSLKTNAKTGREIELQRKLDDRDATIHCLEGAIRWALGECPNGEEFPARKEGQGAYWWRSALAAKTRAALDLTHEPLDPMDV